MENLGLDPKLIISQLINFAVFFFIFSKFMAKPFMDYVKKQKQTELEKEKLTEGLRVREAEIEKEKEIAVKKAKEEAHKILAEAKADGEQLVKDASSRAQIQADDIVTKAKSDIVRMKEEAQRDMQKQVVDTSVLLLNKGLQEYLTEESRKSITKYILDNSSKALKV
jgi:F-type H+-transporting ATPase subunit b